VTNAWNNYKNLEMERERAEFLAQAGRLPEFQVDQTKQDELRAWDRWIRTKATYENALDAFKLELGVPTNMAIELDPSEMTNLVSRGVVPPRIPRDDATAEALENRLDLKNTRDRAEDAGRKVTVAANALKPGLDLTSSMLVETDGDTKPFDFDFDNASYSAGVDITLPLERTAERNIYRQALINQNAAERDLAERVDLVKLDIRNVLRNLEQAEQSYSIQSNSLKLAEQRVESTSLLQQAGRASTRDVLEAREALLEAQNQVSRALVDHFNARLDLFLAMERLRIDDNGIWIEDNDIGP
jgi:outer membrane protein TolC